MNSLLAALVNGGILGAMVTAFVWLVLRLTPRSVLNAATRYAIWWAALALAAALPALYAPRARAYRELERAAPSRSTVLERPAEAVAPSPARTAIHAVRELPEVPPAPVTDFSGAAKRAAPRPDYWPTFPVQVTAEGWPQWILGAWALASVVLLLRLALSCALLRRTSARACDAPAALRAQARTWLALCDSSRRGIRLASSTEIDIPVAVGPLHPSILIPEHLLDELEPADLDQIGLHETAHLARGDDWALLIQRMVEAIFALHPVVRWIARQIDLEREIACDDFVVAATGHARLYATCLTRVVELAGGVGFSLAGASAADDRSHLSQRIEMLLDKTRHRGTRLLRARLTAMIAVLAVLGWIAGKAPGLVAFAKPLARAVWHGPEAPRSMLAQAVRAPQGPLQEFESRVIEDASGDPLASAELRFRQAGARELAADLDTDRQGKVHIAGLPAGDYNLDVMKPNYVTASLRVRVPAPSLLVRLVRYGVITGQVNDAGGRAAPGVIYMPGGRAIGGTRITVLVKTAGSEELKAVREMPVEDGRYRIFDLPPGQYAVGVWYDGLKDGSGVQLYPDNANPRFFTVAGGEEYTGVDFTITPRAVYQVSGKVEGAAAKKQFALALGLPEQPALPIAQTLTEDDGSFRFEQVPAGTYDLFAAGPSVGYGARTTVVGDDPLFGRARVQVGGQNVEGLTIPVSAGRSLTIVTRAQGSDKPPVGCPTSADITLPAMEPWGLFPKGTTAAIFGKELTIRNIAPGRIRVVAGGLGTGCYQTSQPVVDLSREMTNPVVIELAPAGSIHGTLRAGGASASHFVVVLLDIEATAETSAQLAFPDAQGRFQFDGLRPGRYRIAARPAAEGSKARWSADVLHMVEIEVPGGSPTSVELPATLATGDQQ